MAVNDIAQVMALTTAIMIVAAAKQARYEQARRGNMVSVEELRRNPRVPKARIIPLPYQAPGRPTFWDLLFQHEPW